MTIVDGSTVARRAAPRGGRSTAVGALSLLALLAHSSSAAAAPGQIHLTWQGPTDSTIAITWRSTSSSGSVEYGSSAALGQNVAAQSAPYGGGGSHLHHAVITGLLPGTTYHYRCGTAGQWSTAYTFRTAPPAGTAFRFAAYGDSRSNDAARSKVRAAIEARAPAFSINTGDLVGDGNVQSQWDEWFTTMQPLLAVSPLMPAIGNHENNAAAYFTQFALPVHVPATNEYADEAYYSFDYGNVHFVALSTEPIGAVGGAQYQWLRADLAAAAARPAIRWIVVFAHRPPYSSGQHGSNTWVRKTWLHLCEGYGVDVAFWGHDHAYERTKPLFQGAPVAQGGVTYVVTGGAGAPLYSIGSSAFTAFSAAKYNFVEVNVQPTSLELLARDDQGNVFDSVTLSRPAPRPRWVMDGQLDAAAAVVGTGSGGELKSLHATFDGRYLYVATEGLPASRDHFILLSAAPPAGSTAAPWGKAGTVASFSSMLALESSNGWSNWQRADGTNDPGFAWAANPAASRMEGVVDLVGKLGSVPPAVYLAAAAYGTQTGQALLEQIPAGNGDGNIDPGEWIELKLQVPGVVRVADGPVDARAPAPPDVSRRDGSARRDGGPADAALDGRAGGDLTGAGDGGCTCETPPIAAADVVLPAALLLWWATKRRCRRHPRS